MQLRKIFSNTGWFVGERAFRIASAFVVGVLAARSFGPSAYGDLGFCMAVAAAVDGFALLGVDRLVVRDLVRCPEEEPEQMGALLTVRVSSSLVLLGLVAAIVVGTGNARLLPVALCLAAGRLLVALEILDLRFQARLEFGRLAPFRLAVTAVATGARVALLLKGFGLLEFAVIACFEGLLISLGVLLAYRVAVDAWPTFKVSRLHVKKLVAQGWPLFLVINLDILAQRIGPVLLGLLLPRDQFGQFAMASRFLDVPIMLSYLISVSFLPDLVRLLQQDRKAYEGMNLRLMSVWTWTALLATVPMAAVAIPAFRFLLAREYPLTGRLFILMMGAVVAQANGAFRAAHLTVTGNQSALLRIHLLAFLASIPLFYAGARFGGAYGAAIAVSVNGLVSYVALGAVHPESRRFLTLQLKAVLPRWNTTG